MFLWANGEATSFHAENARPRSFFFMFVIEYKDIVNYEPNHDVYATRLLLKANG